MEREAEEMTAVRYLTKDNAVFERTQGGFVSLTFEGKTWDRVQVIRLFPFTEPNGFISIRTVEERSREIGVIKDLKDVSKETKKLLLEQLNLHYFTPIIQKVLSIKDEYVFPCFYRSRGMPLHDQYGSERSDKVIGEEAFDHRP